MKQHRFVTSDCRKNSIRDRVTGKKELYLQRNTVLRQRVWAISESKTPKYGVVILFMDWVIS